ncbi:MAG: ATP-binding protein [Anaerolineales bacterium]|nr:ATP-binding protein [Anaerolineales bacterium]
MNTPSLFASRQIALIGRDKLIQDILAASKTKRPVFILLEGEGGVGKTTILRTVQEQAKGMRFRHILDLYHLEYQTPDGFAWAVHELLPEVNFSEFRNHYHDMQQARDTHDAEAEQEAWRKAERAWLGALNSQTWFAPLWMFLDTLEVLPVPSTEDESHELLSWLARVLPNIKGPLIVVAAGRASDACAYLWKQIPDEHFKKWKPSLRYLSEQETLLYMQKTIELLQAEDAIGAQRIQAYLNKWGSAPLHRQTQGKPLRLAIVADILRTGGSLPEAFYQPDAEKKDSSQELDRALVEHLSRLTSPLGEIIQTMASLRKGIDARLLQHVMQISPEEAESYLRQVQTLTLVKKRPGDEVTRPYFLHDEMYELFSRYRPLAESARRALFESLEVYYQEEISHWRNELKQFSPLRGRYLKRWRLAQIERMHYALWMNSLRGYSDYFILVTDIRAAGDTSTLSMVINEMRTTLDWCKRFGMDDARLTPYLENDKNFRMVEDLLRKDLSFAQKLLNEMAQTSLPPLLRAYWNYLYAIVGIRQGQRSMTTFRLNTPVNLSLKAALESAETLNEPELEDAREALLSYIDNYLGYQNRREGKYQHAHRYYQESAARMRRLGLSGVDGVLTNQAYAMSMLGFDRRAYETAREAAEMALQSNDVRGQIRALNVMAFVVLRTGQPERARGFVEKALKLLARVPGDDRLKGIVLIHKAMTERQAWNQIVSDNLVDWRQEWVKTLPQALYALEGKTYVQQKLGLHPTVPGEEKEAEKGAIALLKDHDAENLTVAQNESGNCWREVAWALRDLAESDERKQRVRETCVQMARVRFLQAAGIQHEKEEWKPQIQEQVKRIGGSPYWPTIALVNLAWHEHYQKNDSNLPFYTSLVHDIIGQDYLWPPKINPDEAELQRWVALGKLEMLHCFHHLRRWESEQKQEDLHQAMHSAALSLEYNYCIGQTSHDLRRAEISLETRFRASRNWETRLLPLFYQDAQSLKEEFKPILPPGKQPRLLHWLSERFGNYDLWR